jgi:hypothetical protein
MESLKLVLRREGVNGSIFNDVNLSERLEQKQHLSKSMRGGESHRCSWCTSTSIDRNICKDGGATIHFLRKKT